MKSIATIYRIGPGPSSSHTLALKRACECFKTHVSSIHSIHATLVGSLRPPKPVSMTAYWTRS